MRILIAEDNYESILLYEIMFEKEEVKILTDGDSFIMNYSENYDVIILDLNIPKKSGIEVLEFLKSVKNKIPVFIVTALNNMDYLKAENVYVIYKPIIIDELRKKIIKCVK
jgi:DNA-binding response OmpR family regulator